MCVCVLGYGCVWPPGIVFMRRLSASATLVLCHSRGGESHLTHLQSQRWCLSAGAVVQLVSVSSVWPALLLMQAAVSANAHSLNQMTKHCVNADVRLHWNPPPPCPLLSAFGLTPSPPLGADVLYGWPLSRNAVYNGGFLKTFSYSWNFQLDFDRYRNFTGNINPN